MGTIRLLLAISVVLAHSSSLLGSTLVGGQIAVQSFYIISGFYMSLILNEKYVGSNGSYRLFISNRFYRLYPVYWMVLLMAVLFSVVVLLFSKGFTHTTLQDVQILQSNPLSLLLLLASNLVIFGQDLIMFVGIVPDSAHLYFTSNFAVAQLPAYKCLFVPQAWTLGIELTFYLIAPFIFRKGIRLVILLLLLSLLLRFIAYNQLALQHDPWTYRFFPFELFFFLCGYLSYALLQKIRQKNIPTYVANGLLLLTVTATFFYADISGIRIAYLPFSLKEIAFFSLIVLSIPFLFNAFKRSKLDARIGELSYPVYIVHMLVITVVGVLSTRFTGWHFLTASWFIVSITLLLSILLNQWIAKPIEAFRQKRLN